LSERSISRALLRFGAVTTAAVLMFGVANASAQEDTPSAPTETTTATPPPSSTPEVSVPTQPSTPTSEPTTPSTPPAERPAAAVLPDLKATAKLDKAHYQSHETVHAKVTITNPGQVAAERVVARFPYGIEYDPAQWGDLRIDGPGIRIEPGKSVTVDLSGTISSVDNGRMRFWGQVISRDGDVNEQDNYFSAEATVTQTRGGAAGVVYADKNRNGSLDAGETLEGAKVSIYGGSPSGSFETVTDASGRFAFKDVPAGDYGAWYDLPGGWVVRWTGGPEHKIVVPPGGTAEISARGVRPVSESLTAAVALDKDTYAVGEVAGVDITLTNTGDTDIAGITAGCNRIGNDNQLGRGAGWGDLRSGGVTVKAGQTRTFHVTEPVPAAARDYGEVVVGCDFEPNADYNTDGPSAVDSARVPGGVGTFGGQLAQDQDADWIVDPGEGIANTKIVLLDNETRKPVTHVITGENGVFKLDGVPSGNYRMVVVGPWKLADQGEWADFVEIRSFGNGERNVFVVPGPLVADPTAPPGSPAPPGGAPSGPEVRDALAKTGASALGLSVLGGLVLAFGIGLRAAGRRNTVRTS
jgi:hypothetical protein